MYRMIWASLSLLCSAEIVLAQTVLQVPYDKAVITWDAAKPASPAGCLTGCAGETRWYVMNCGSADIKIDIPATSVPVKTVASSPGSYSCQLWAVNNFGRSLPAVVPKFEAGFVPAMPDNVRIEVR